MVSFRDIFYTLHFDLGLRFLTQSVTDVSDCIVLKREQGRIVVKYLYLFGPVVGVDESNQ